jgi:hypothetical protein
MGPPHSKHQWLIRPRFPILLSVVLVGMALAFLAGCGFSGSSTAIQAPVTLRGTVHGGQKPVSGAKVQLYSAGTAGRGSASIPLLSTPVDSDSEGDFLIPASYYCPFASSQLYLIARGGNPGLPSGADNPAIALTTMLGACGGLTASSPISINEVTTVGSVWPVASYMKSPTDLGSTAGDSAFLSAASSVNQFIDIAQGSSPGVATPVSYFAESAKLYSLADVLDKCVNSPGGSAGDGSACGALFSMATPQGGGAPTDTMSAAMRIAQSPYNEVSGIYGLTAAPAAFQPTLTAAPSDWTLALSEPVATPVISLGTGSYVGSQTVTMSDATPGATIYYTTDGTTPSSASLAYSGPLSISVTASVQAVALEGISQSALASSTLTITSGAVAQAPAKLAFLQQPSNALAGAAISPAVRVVVQDVNGNTVSSATNLVRVNLTGVYGLGGTLEIAARGGVATFNNLTVTTAGSYTVTASSPGLTSAASKPFTVTAASVNGIAAKLAFLQQPSNILAGAVMTPPVRVAVEDANGNVVTSAANPVTLALTSGTGLSGMLTVTPLSGVATFSNFTANTGGSYSLIAASPSLASASSTQFTVTTPPPVSGVAAKLAFLQQPSNALVGAAISPAVRVVVEDANGNTVASATNLISVNLTGVYGLGGTLEIAARNGVATFNNLAVNTAGSYTLTTSTPSLASALSTQFTVSASPPVTGVATKLAFLQQPSSTVAGATMAPPVQVASEDANGNVAMSANNPVTLALTGGIGITGALTVKPQNGVATFSNLTVPSAGTGLTLLATSPGLVSATSASFIVSVPVSTSVNVVLTPGTVNLAAAQAQAFSTTVSGTTNTGITWSLSPSLGTISATGLYTAPSYIPFAQRVIVTATSVADPTKSASASVLLSASGTPPTVAITVSPASASAVIGTTTQFTAAVSGTSNATVTWSVSGPGCSDPSCGTISSSGLYTAPTAEPTSGSVVISATSVSDPTKSASANLSVVPPQAVGYSLVWQDTFSTLNLCNNTNSPNCNWFNGTVGGNYGRVTDPSGTNVNLGWQDSQIYPTTIATASPNGLYYHAWTFGYFEVSMAFDPVAGSWPALWMQPVQSIGQSPFSGGEIDMLEWQSSATGQPNIATAVNGTIHVWQNGVDVASNSSSAAVQVPSGTNFGNYNTYGVLWTSTSFSWYFNNTLMGTYSTLQAPFNQVFGGQQKYFLILSQLTGCNWKPSYTVACPDQVSPLNMKIQWVHVFGQP